MINFQNIREYIIEEKGWKYQKNTSELNTFYLPILKKRKQVLEKYFDTHIGSGRVKVGYRTTELRLHTDVPLSQFII